MLSHSVGGSLFVTPWTVAHQVPLSMELSRQEYWSGLPFPPPGDLPDSGIEPTSLASHVSYIAGRFFTSTPPGKLFYEEVTGKLGSHQVLVLVWDHRSC